MSPITRCYRALTECVSPLPNGSAITDDVMIQKETEKEERVENVCVCACVRSHR